MHRFLLPLFALAFLLTSCGGGGGLNCAAEYRQDGLNVCLPEGWTAMDKETMNIRGIPEETIAVFRMDESLSGQFPSVAVTRENLSAPVEARNYSEAGIRSVSVLPGYTLIDSSEITVSGEEVKLHVFSAQPIAGEPARRFHQASTVHGQFGYTITAATPLFIEKNLEEQIKFIIENVVFVEEEAK